MPLVAVSTSNPTLAHRSASNLTMEGSSSAISILGGSSLSTDASVI